MEDFLNPEKDEYLEDDQKSGGSRVTDNIEEEL